MEFLKEKRKENWSLTSKIENTLLIFLYKLAVNALILL